MSQYRELTSIERDLNGALVSLNVSRSALNAKLSAYFAGEGAQDRLIYLADEYGTNHALEVLRDRPEAFGLPRAEVPSVEELSKALEYPYTFHDKVGLMNAEKQIVLRESDASLPKVVMVNGRPMVYDPEAGKELRLDTGKTKDMDLANVVPEHSHDQDKDEEEERGM